MRLPAVFVAAALLAASVAAAQSTPPPAAQRERLAAEVAKLRGAGRLAEAAACAKKLAVERELLGERHEDVFTTLLELAELYEIGEDFATARKVREEVLALRRRDHGDHDWRVADAREYLADLDRMVRMDAAQRRQFHKATTLTGRVVQLMQQGRAREAVPLAEEALALRRATLGERHRLCATSLINLAAQYQAVGDYPKALAHYEQARALLRDTLGTEHPHYAACLNGLGLVYRNLGDFDRALPLYEEAVRLRGRLTGEDNASFASYLNTLAMLHHARGEHRQALPLLERSRELRRRVLPADHPHH